MRINYGGRLFMEKNNILDSIWKNSAFKIKIL